MTPAFVSGPIRLGAAPVRTTLKAAGQPSTLDARSKALEQGRRLALRVEGLRADAPPGVLYRIYLNLPAGTPPEKGSEYLVGRVNFFDAVGHAVTVAVRRREIPFAESQQGHGHPAFKESRGRTPELTIVPVGQPAAGSNPTIGRISIVERVDASVFWPEETRGGCHPSR